MDRYAIFVDAGYLTSQAIRIVSNGKVTQRNQLKLHDPALLVSEFRKLAEAALLTDRLLRIYWYDGVGHEMTPEQISLAVLPDVQFRAGTIHNKKQKGVDSRIVHDLFELASNHAISDAMIVTGDGDLAVGIEFAQRRGMRIALLSVEDVPNGVGANRHKELTYLADRQVTFGGAVIRRLFGHISPQTVPLPEPVATPKVAIATGPKQQKPISPTSPADPAIVNDILRKVVSNMIAELPLTTVLSSVNEAGGILNEIDRKLLLNASHLLERKLDTLERNELRELFKASVLAQSATP